MNVTAMKAYSDKSVELNENLGIERDRNQVKKQDIEQNKRETLKAKDNVITTKERDFFIDMFPDNTEQLKKHTLFNRNGKLMSTNVNKGTMLDGKA
jgi:hypothetical protein